LYGTTVLVCRNRGCISVSDPDPAFLKSEKPYVVLYIRLFLRAVDKAVIVCHPPIRVDFTTSPRICLARMLRYDVPAGCMGISQSLVADRVYTDPGMSYRLRRPVA
jgi:hypothetical protein